jgi:bifunctional non-homologous end joining protein LigD
VYNSTPLPFVGTADQQLKIDGQPSSHQPEEADWRSPKISKQDVIDYYRVAPVLLPHLEDRPLSMKRYPNGAYGAGGAPGGFFYQKNVPDPKPRFVETVTVKHSTGPTRYAIVNNRATLLWAANLADLEIHPWYSDRASNGRRSTTRTTSS